MGPDHVSYYDNFFYDNKKSLKDNIFASSGFSEEPVSYPSRASPAQYSSPVRSSERLSDPSFNPSDPFGNIDQRDRYFSITFQDATPGSRVYKASQQAWIPDNYRPG